MDFATYLEVVSDLNPSVEELAPLHEIIEMRLSGYITEDELVYMLYTYYEYIIHPLVSMQFPQFKYHFYSTEKVFYTLLDAKFAYLYVTNNVKLAFLSLLSQQNSVPFLTQDNFIKFLLVLSKPSEFTDVGYLIEAAIQLLQTCNAVAGCVSAGYFLYFLISQHLDERAIRALELGCQQLEIRDVAEILKSAVPDARSRELIFNANLLRAGAPLDSNLAQKLKYLCKQNKCNPDGINEFLIQLKSEYELALRRGEKETVVKVENGNRASCDIDALVLAAEWVSVEIGGRKDEFLDTALDQKLYDAGDDRKIMELYKYLGYMKRVKSKK